MPWLCRPGLVSGPALAPLEPTRASEALELLEYAAGLVADLDAAEMPAEALGECVQGVEGVESVLAAAIGRLLAAYDAKDGHLADGQRTLRAWLVNADSGFAEAARSQRSW